MPASDQAHKLEAVPDSRHIKVEVAGVLVAETRSPLLVHEPGHPPRFYVPQDDVVRAALRPSDTSTFCPYKGHASYWSCGDVTDVAWSYRDPISSVPEIAGHISFGNPAEVSVVP